MKQELEIRNTSSISTESDSRLVSGYAVVFNSQSEDLGFREIIKPSAITEETLANSDVFCRFNHDENRILARNNHGKGSLVLRLDEKGLYYEFEAPKTDLGDELLEFLRRGDICCSSFAFRVAQDEDAEYWYKDENGEIHREINKIDLLADVSPVWNPAYSATSVSARALEKVESMKEEEIEEKIEETKEAPEKEEESTEETTQEENPVEEEKPTDDEKESDEEPKEEAEEEKVEEKDSVNGSDEEEEQSVEDSEEEDNKEENEEPKEENEEAHEETHKRNLESVNTPKINQKFNTNMKTNFSIVKAIKSVAENRSMDEVAQAVNAAGFEEMRKAGLSASGQIILPMETRAITVADEGGDVVATELYSIVEPLRAKNVLIQAGAKFISGLSGNVQIPVMTGANVAWAGEVAAAGDGNPSFDSITLSPKRLTAYVDISKMLLAQDSIGVENMIRQDLINAINSKLEATILGNAAVSSTQPAGMFNGVTPTTVADFKDVVDLEAAVEAADVYGNLAYIASPTAKACFRDMQKGSNGTAYLAYAGGELDGVPVYSTSNVAANKFIVGDFSNLAIGQFGGIDLVVDPYTKAANGQIRLVVNAYFDAKVIRSVAFAYGAFA